MKRLNLVAKRPKQHRYPICWAFSDKPTSELTMIVLRLAVQKRRIQDKVALHSDQGCQCG